MGAIFQVVVNGMRGEKMMVDLCNTEEQFKKMTVLQLKKKIVEKLPGSAEGQTLRLIFVGKTLDEDDRLLSHFGIQHLSVIQMVLRLPGGLIA